MGEAGTWKVRVLETTRTWIMITVMFVATAILIHVTAQTYFFTSGYFTDPNLYDVFPRVDEVTHAVSAMAVAAAVLNFNLPLTFRKKWMVAMALGFLIGSIWEVAEYITAPIWKWIHISTTDTLLDLWQDFLGSSFSILLYSHLVRTPRLLYTPSPQRARKRKFENHEIEEMLHRGAYRTRISRFELP